MVSGVSEGRASKSRDLGIDDRPRGLRDRLDHSRATAALALHHALGPQGAERLTHSVPADAVLHREGDLRRNAIGELARAQASAQVLAHLSPQRG